MEVSDVQLLKLFSEPWPADDIIDFQDHADQLSCEQQLLPLGNERVGDILLVHVVGAKPTAVDSSRADF